MRLHTFMDEIGSIHLKKKIVEKGTKKQNIKNIEQQTKKIMNAKNFYIHDKMNIEHA